MFTFQFQITENDYVEYNLYHAYTTPAFRKRFIVAKYIGPVLFLAFSIIYSQAENDPWTFYIVFGILSVLWLIFFRQIFVVNLFKKQLKLMKKSGKMPFGKDITMIFDEENIKSESEEGQMSAPYSTIERIVIGENALYLYKRAVEAFPIPFRAFNGEEEKKAFLQFIQQKTNAPVIPGVTK